MANAELIESLNRALGLELSGVIQYMQHSFLVTGPEREVFRGFFRDLSGEARDHAGMLGDKIVALGGVPTVEPGEIRQSTNLGEMAAFLVSERNSFMNGEAIIVDGGAVT